MLEPKVAMPLILKKSIIIIQICPLKARKSKLLSVFDSCDELAKKYSRLDCFFAVRKCTFILWWHCSGVSSAESDNQSLKLRSLPWRSFPEIITSVHKVKKTKKRNRQLSQKLDKKRWQIKLNRIKFCLCSKIYFLNKESLLLWLFSTRKHFLGLFHLTRWKSRATWNSFWTILFRNHDVIGKKLFVWMKACSYMSIR